MRITSTLAATAVLAAVAAGCADDGPPTEEPPPQTESTSESTTDSPPATDEVVRATGTIVKGVEPGCLLLETGEARYLLLGGDRNLLEPGRRLTVTGFAAVGKPTTCMEGIPLEVADITPTG